MKPTVRRTWLRFAGAVGAGVVAAFGQAPYDLPIIMFLSAVALVFLFRYSPRPLQAAAVGWGFALGYFMHGWTWLLSPFMVDAERYAWMAPFALVLLCGGLALFWGLAFGVARWLSPRSWPLIILLPAGELLRGYLFTGFPWGMFSQGLVNLWPGQGLAVIGPYGMTLLFVGLAVACARPASGGLLRRVGMYALWGVAALLLILPFNRSGAALTDFTIRMVQPNAAQKDKWDPAKIPEFFDRQLALTSAPPAPGSPEPDLILWSETAIAWPLDLAQGALDYISAAADGKPVVLGVQRRTETQFYNSAVLLGPSANVTQTYDKHHLVPFGEYVPFADVMNRWGIRGIASQFNSGFSAGPGAELMDLGPLGQALPLICYEAVFARDVNAAPKRPAFLMQLTNDAWFGKGQGPLQHLAQARMRAIEQGLPMARVANTGVSAMIDPWGQVTASLALNQAGFLDARLPAPRAATIYSRLGEWPFLAILFAGFSALVVVRSRESAKVKV
ncbi:hypothetical protein LCGC14_0486240 [marine sediment metagenome]|uniref:CN hydrolase domain-containing protein n=1 Tax=marine sediment metagenome TaxID=412755 RepID=A0A0F9SD84_9ZZZZ|tara:strand:- start:176 stop:1684 length:1509 start_codon:yes stop_codon:yes gene_type:complete